MLSEHEKRRRTNMEEVQIFINARKKNEANEHSSENNDTQTKERNGVCSHTHIF
jgi:hypothetical protein